MKQSDPKQAQRVPLGQILLDDVFLLLLVGLVVPFIIYTVWGLMDIGGIPPLPDAPVSGVMVEHTQTPTPVVDGAQLVQAKGCLGCHSLDGSTGVGPTWKGIFGRQETLADGTTIAVDDAYLVKSIREPGAQLVQGFANLMPPYALSDAEMQALIGYLKGL